MKTKKQRRSRFWQVYAVTVAVLLIAVCAGLFVFYDFIRAYEVSQPLNTAEEFVASLTEDTVSEWIDGAAASLNLPYESSQTAADACRSALSALPDSYSCQREYSVSAESPTYILLRGDTRIGRFTLMETEGGRYGFPEWEIGTAEAILEYLEAGNITLTIYAPDDSVVSVNGIVLTEKELLTAEAVYPYTSPFESTAKITAQLYKISGLYGDAEVRCTLSGTECESVAEGDTIRFLYPGNSLQTYTITAPHGSDILVNGISLTADYRTNSGLRYSSSEVEADAQNLPAEEVYSISGLIAEPSVTASLEGIALDVTIEGTTFRAAYPNALMYSAKIRVPQGSTVTVRGVCCAPYRTDETEAAYPELFTASASSPAYDIYRLNNLYLPIEEIAVEYNGVPLPLTETCDGRTSFVEAYYPLAENSDVHTLALTFAKDYFDYVSYGYSNTDANLEKVLTHVQKGSDLYARLQRSLIGIQFVTPVSSQSYNTLKITEMRSLPGGDVYCLAEFDIDQTIYYVKRSYTGTLALNCTIDDSSWFVNEMRIESEN